MNKKLFLGALLVGAIALNSCVDDKESASVTAIRNAKVEQLKALAEATTLNAQANLALTNAQAAAQQALAAYNQALAAQTEAQTEKEKELAAVEVQEAQARLQATLASYEKEIAVYKYNQAYYEGLLAGLKKDADAEAARELDNLINAFNTASKNLIDAKRDLARANADLITLQADLEDMSTTINNSIQNLENQNAEKKVEIANQQAIIDTYEKYAGTTVSQKDIDAAHLKMVELQTAQAKANEEYNAANDSVSEAYTPLTEYRDKVQPWIDNNYNMSYGVWNETTGRWDDYNVDIMDISAWNTFAPATARGKWCVVINYNRNNSKDYLPLFEEVNWNWDNELDYTLSYGDQSYSYGTIETWYNLIDGGKALETLVSYKEKQVNAWSNLEYLEQLKKNLADYQKEQAAAQTAFDNAVKAYDAAVAAREKAVADVTAAEKAWDDAYKAAQTAQTALDNNTDATKTETLQKALDAANTALNEATTKRDNAYDAQNKAWTAENDANNARDNALSTLDNATENVNNTQEWLNNAEFWKDSYAKDLEDFKAKVDELIEMASSVDANVKAYNDAKTVAAKAFVANEVAIDAANVQSQEYYTLFNAGDGGIVDGNWEANWKVISAKNEINNLTQQIKNNEDWIETYKQDLADLEAGKNYAAELQKSWIEDKKAEIERDTVEVETCQQKYDIAKEALEAAIKSDEPAETPAE